MLPRGFLFIGLIEQAGRIPQHHDARASFVVMEYMVEKEAHVLNHKCHTIQPIIIVSIKRWAVAV